MSRLTVTNVIFAYIVSSILYDFVNHLIFFYIDNENSRSDKK